MSWDEAPIAESFKGDGSAAHTFSEVRTGLVLYNKGEDMLTFSVGGQSGPIEIDVPSGERFRGRFREFIKVEVSADGEYSGYVI